MEESGESQGEGLVRRNRLKEGAYAVAFMVALCVVFIGAIAALRLAVAGRIRVNRNLLTQRQYLEALGLTRWRPGETSKPNLTPDQIAALFREGKQVEVLAAPKDGGPPRVLAYGKDGKLESVGLLLSWPGFWGPIDAIVALTPDLTRIKGLSFLKHGETPGLGARMTEPKFRGQFFEGTKSVKGIGGAPATVLVPEDASAAKPDQINAITGATRTSDSIVKFMNGKLPEAVRRYEALRARKGGP